MKHRVQIAAGLAAAMITGGVIAIAIRGGRVSQAAASTAALSTATVARTDLATTTLTEGTLGYAPSVPVLNRLTGTYTQLPPAGSTIGFGDVLYRVDDLPVVLMRGATPAWRPFTIGMTDGPDVTELQSDLIALDDATGLLTVPDGHFGPRTAVAVERWQRANHLTATGQIGLGQIVFLTRPLLVGAPDSALGQPAEPGGAPFAVTTTARAVTVPLNPNLPAVTIGERVTIVLPTNATTPGRITAVGPAPATTPGNSSEPPANSNTQTPPQTASAVATVTPDIPSATGSAAGVAVQVSLTTQEATDVLAAPISALLALAGGGYGVEVVDATGGHHLVGVSTGLFTGSQVQISGPGIESGTTVVVSQ